MGLDGSGIVFHSPNFPSLKKCSFLDSISLKESAR